jgi:hypothetical protein
VLPNPPFDCDLTPERELEEFQRLKPKLASVWGMLTANENQPSTSVVVPSLTLDAEELTLDAEELTKLAGASYYEKKLLFLLIRLRNPRAHVVYVTSQPVHPLTLDYRPPIRVATETMTKYTATPAARPPGRRNRITRRAGGRRG